MKSNVLLSDILEAIPCAPAFIGRLNPFALGSGYYCFFNGRAYYAFQHDGQLFSWLPEFDSATLRIKKTLLGMLGKRS